MNDSELLRDDPPRNGHTRRRIDTRKKILAAADELFEENGGATGGGYDRTTVDMIAERADVSRRNFFNHFESKSDALLLDMAAMIRDHAEATRLRPPTESVFDAVVNSVVDALNAFASDPLNERRAQRYAKMRSLADDPSVNVVAWETALQSAIELRRQDSGPAENQYAQRIATEDRLAITLALSIVRLATHEWMSNAFERDIRDCLQVARQQAQGIIGE